MRLSPGDSAAARVRNSLPDSPEVNRSFNGRPQASNLRGKTILLISPNNWGAMRVSKHHFAVELAARGNRVFFLNPPDFSLHNRLAIEPVAEHPGLSVVTYRPFVPFTIRFHSRALFNAIAGYHARWVARHLATSVDIVWCFDVNLYADLRWFGAPVRIFHPVDQVEELYQRQVASTATLVLSVSEEILRHVRAYHVPSHVIGHGLAGAFVDGAQRRLADLRYEAEPPLRVGYVGNLFIKYLDRATIRTLVNEHPDVVFHFWGPASPAESNVGADDTAEAASFIAFLRERANTQLHGKQHPDVVAEALERMDLLLICYAVADDPNRGCNSHKILEYLSTGRVIVANHVPDYSNRPDLIRMVPTVDNAPLPGLFASTIRDVAVWNSPERQATRLSYALSNTYQAQLNRIEAFIQEAASRGVAN